MIFLKLFLEFLKVGLFAFGGAYGAIPLIEDIVTTNAWLDTGTFTNVVALSEATPGPFMVNMATFVGYRQGGVAGAVCATAGVILPSFISILLLTTILQAFIKNPVMQAMLSAVKPCLLGIILSAGLVLFVKQVSGSSNNRSVWLIAAVLILIRFVYRKVRKKELPPIVMLMIAACAGLILF